MVLSFRLALALLRLDFGDDEEVSLQQAKNYFAELLLLLRMVRQLMETKKMVFERYCRKI